MNFRTGSHALLFDTLDWERSEAELRKSKHREKDRANEKRRRLCCAACRQPITVEQERIFVQGRHEHTFSNPHGITFHIGCFATASGCAHLGQATEEWTWFKGYRWQIAVCGSCSAHMGWRYASRGGDGFHGLILSHLVTEDRVP